MGRNSGYAMRKFLLLTLSLSVFAFIIFAKITPNDVRAFPSRQSPKPPPEEVPIPPPEDPQPEEDPGQKPTPPPPTPTPCIPNWCFVQQTTCCFDPICIFLGETTKGAKNRCDRSPGTLKFFSGSSSKSVSIISKIGLFIQSFFR